MQYISPFRLLGLDITEISQNPDSINVSFLKKKLLAEFELSNSATIGTEAGELSKNDVLEILDQLQSPEILNYHFQIAGDAMLLDFLQYNALNGVFAKNPIYKDDGFLKFIAPYFSNSYCMLVNYILDNEDASNSFLYRIPLLIPSGEGLKSLQPISKKIYDIIAGIEHYTDEFAKRGTAKIAVDRKLFGFNIIRTLNALDYTLFEHDIELYGIAALKLINESIDVKRRTFRDIEFAYFVLKQIENLKLRPDLSNEVKRFLGAFIGTPEQKQSDPGVGCLIYIIIVAIVLIRLIPKGERSTPDASTSINELLPPREATMKDTVATKSTTVKLEEVVVTAKRPQKIEENLSYSSTSFSGDDSSNAMQYRRVFTYLKIGNKVGYTLGREGGIPEYSFLKTGDNPYKTLPSLDIDTKEKENSLKLVNNSNLNVLGFINSDIGNVFVYVSSKDSIVIGTNAEAVNIFFAAGKRWDKACKVPRLLIPGEITYAKDIYGLFTETPPNLSSLVNVTQIQFVQKKDKKKKSSLFTPTFRFYNNGDSVKVDSFIPQQENEEEQIRGNSREDSLNAYR
ncbi:MAG TPA: hypothetical protein VHO90_17590 [Bacteroidales bacterium]|nr:hypothetical protein [Bacteroidales bacterium]